eukprot:4672629-Amphidinium_carterae.1
MTPHVSPPYLNLCLCNAQCIAYSVAQGQKPEHCPTAASVRKSVHGVTQTQYEKDPEARERCLGL